MCNNRMIVFWPCESEEHVKPYSLGQASQHFYMARLSKISEQRRKVNIHFLQAWLIGRCDFSLNWWSFCMKLAAFTYDVLSKKCQTTEKWKVIEMAFTDSSTFWALNWMHTSLSVLKWCCRLVYFDPKKYFKTWKWVLYVAIFSIQSLTTHSILLGRVCI